MQTRNRVFDDLARVTGGALGALSGLREEVELLVRSRLERVLADMNLVSRDEFEAVQAMAAKAREENEQLAARLEALEKQLATGPKKAAAPATAKTTPPRRRNAPRTAATAKAKPTVSPRPTTTTPQEPSGGDEGPSQD